MMNEASSLVEESKKVEGELKIALEQEKTSDRDAIAVEAIRAERDSLLPEFVAAQNVLSAYKQSGNTVHCNGDATCGSQVDAYNVIVDRRNALLAQIEAANTAQSVGSERVKSLHARRQQITQRIAFLRSQVAALRGLKFAKEFASGTQHCKNIASREGESHCLMHYWAPARADTPAMGNRVKPEFSATSRTAEEAIAEYKGSGQLRQLPKEFRTRALKPPSPNLGSSQ